MKLILFMILTSMFFIKCSNNSTDVNYIKSFSITAPNIDTSFSIIDTFDSGDLQIIRFSNLRLKTNSIIWIYDTSTNVSDLNVYIKGYAKSDKLGIEVYGDGIYRIQDVTLNDHYFEDTTTIAFMYKSEEYLKNDTYLIMYYGTDNDSFKILLKNPLN
jgi:hypothetical protein